MAINKKSVFAPYANEHSDPSDDSLQAQIDDLNRRVTALEQESKLPSDGSGGGIRNPNAESLGRGEASGNRG
jgi:hypothetical protein